MNLLKHRTLIVGIGGTGFQCVSKIKEKTQILYGGIPSGIKFCSLDTGSLSDNRDSYKKVFDVESTINSADPYRTDEWFKVTRNGNFNYKFKLEHPEENDDLSFVNVSKLLTQIRRIDFAKGAGQKRILGKIAFYYHRNEIKNHLAQSINELSDNDVDGVDENDTLDVYIIGSIAGGTGSGFLLDVMILIEELLSDKNLMSNVYTFNLLPDVYIKEKAGVWKSNVYPNAFAALCEMEYIYENLQNFIPTKGVKNLADIDIQLPKQNFLIDNIVLNGVDVNHRAMLNATAQVVSNICRSDFGQGTQMGNSDASINPDPNKKPKRFSSLGYSEIFFDQEALSKYTIAKIIEKSWKAYDYSTNYTENDLQLSLEQLKNLIENYDKNLLGVVFEDNEDANVNAASLESIIFLKPKINLKTKVRLRSEMDTNLVQFSNKLKELINEKYQKNIFKNFIENLIVKITNASNDEFMIKEQLQNIIKHLKSLKDHLTHESNDLEQLKASFNTENDKHMRNLVGKAPSTFFNVFGMLKKSKYISFLNGEMRRVSNLIHTSYRDIIVLEEVNRLINNDLEICINLITNDNVEFNTGKINELLKQQKVDELAKSSQNIIHLESYFVETIEHAIENDHNIGKQLIEDYLNDTHENVEEYILSKSNLMPIAYLNRLVYKDISQIKELLGEEQIKDITGKLTRTAKPLWNRADDHTITRGASGDAFENGDLVRYTFLEVPDKDGDYFGKGTLNVRQGDISESDHKHRQSFIMIEEGLAAYQFKTLKKYYEELKRQESNNPDSAVQNFVYDDLRVKFEQDEIGPYNF